MFQATKQSMQRVTKVEQLLTLKPPEELAVELELVLTNMEKESTASSDKPGVVSSVHLVDEGEVKTTLGKNKKQQRCNTHLQQLLHCTLNTWLQERKPAVKIVVLQVC